MLPTKVPETLYILVNLLKLTLSVDTDLASCSILKTVIFVESMFFNS